MKSHRLLAAIVLALALALPAPALGADCASPGTYTVQRGDTLYSIARRFGTTTAALAGLNRLADANRIYVGQVLSLPGGAGCPTGGARVHVVQRGETLSRIAARYGTTVAAIVAANGISNPSRIYPGQRLVIPGAAPAPSPAAGLPGLRLAPATPEQGRTLFVYLPVEGRSGVTGSLGPSGNSTPALAGILGTHRRTEDKRDERGAGVLPEGGPWPLHFSREGDTFVGLVGIYALADPGAYTLSLAWTDAAGQASTYTQPITVVSGGYARENIVLSDAKSQLLDPQLTIPERQHVAAVVAAFTPTRYWQGAFQLPAAGRITSQFGTRRSYNGGPYSSFHGGVDFSISGGASIVAPAAGVVVLAEPLIVRGNATIIDHGWGVYSGFWHQSEILVQVGQRVEAGQLIGRIGATGLATGPHLHWEMLVGGVQVDPLQWTRQSYP